MTEFFHQPVMPDECIEGLNILPNGIYVDGTLGRAGHSLRIVSQLTTGQLICIDQDDAALEAAKSRLAEWMDRVTLVHGNFRDIGVILEQLNFPQVHGMLFDFGISSPQLEEWSRGFSYQVSGPLDMRMDRTATLTAGTVVNEWPAEELKRILYTYGEERYAAQIVRAIVKRRADKPFETTAELVETIKSAMPAHALREPQHPAKRSFQAIRIAVNDELTAISDMIPAAVEKLAPGGRLVTLSFHSLEDRIVKTTMNNLAKGCNCPPNFPVCVCGRQPILKVLTRKPMVPSAKEREENPRSRSAKLRLAEKL